MGVRDCRTDGVIWAAGEMAANMGEGTYAAHLLSAWGVTQAEVESRMVTIP